MMNLGEKEVRHQERRSAWCRVEGQGECWWWCRMILRGANPGQGAPTGIEERRRGLRTAYAAEQPMHAKQRRTRREVKSLEWNRGAPNRGWGGDWGGPILEEERRQKRKYGALNEISKHQFTLRRAEGIEECRRGLRSAYYSGRAPLGGGGYEAAPPCAIWIWWVQWLRQKCNLSPWKGKIYLDIHLEKT